MEHAFRVDCRVLGRNNKSVETQNSWWLARLIHQRFHYIPAAWKDSAIGKKPQFSILSRYQKGGRRYLHHPATHRYFTWC
jgi:hypothetical protein